MLGLADHLHHQTAASASSLLLLPLSDTSWSCLLSEGPWAETPLAGGVQTPAQGQQDPWKPILWNTGAAHWTELPPAPRKHAWEEETSSPHDLSAGRKVLPGLGRG